MILHACAAAALTHAPEVYFQHQQQRCAAWHRRFLSIKELAAAV
jgi:hypothetical protein